MKIYCCLILFLLPLVSTSQKNFEGTIFYKGYNSFDKDTIYAEGVYGKTMMKFASWKIVNGQKEMYGAYEMYNMAHGLHYSISTRTKTYTVDSIKNASDEEQLERLETGMVEIAGHQTVRYGWEIRKDSVISDKLTVGNGLSYWFTKDIHYIVPEPYRNRNDLFTDERGNCIWLQMKLNINYDTASNDNSSKSDLTVFCTATSIVPGKVSENNFSIPPSYKKGTNIIPDREIEIKSIVVEKDEIEPPPPPPPPKPAKPKTIKKNNK